MWCSEYGQRSICFYSFDQHLPSIIVRAQVATKKTGFTLKTGCKKTDPFLQGTTYCLEE